jgi:hypothetical protein
VGRLWSVVCDMKSRCRRRLRTRCWLSVLDKREMRVDAGLSRRPAGPKYRSPNPRTGMITPPVQPVTGERKGGEPTDGPGGSDAPPSIVRGRLSDACDTRLTFRQIHDLYAQRGRLQKERAQGSEVDKSELLKVSMLRVIMGSQS